MTVSSETNKSGPYDGNGVTTIFDYKFKIVDEQHLAVIKRDTSGVEITLEIDTDYTVSGVGNPLGGQIETASAPATGETITLLRNVPIVQETDLENQGAYYAETVEEALDLAAMRDQQLQEQVTRSVKIPASADVSALDTLIADIVRLGDSADSIDTVAENIDDVVLAADHLPEIQAAPAAASTAISSANAAQASETKADKWANNPEDVPVEPGKFSAYHWSKKAEDAAGGGVTSVGLSAPTGFTVSGSPVTDSGTLTFAYASGYTGFTTALQSKLNGIEAGAQVNAVTSVAGKTGAVTLAKGDVGLSNVDNTSDANKPVSSAQAAAIGAKADPPSSGSTTSSATITPSGGSIWNQYFVTAQAAAATIAAPSGTIANGNRLILRIKDNGTARALTWNAVYRGVVDALPATTTVGKTLYLGFIYNSADSKWDMIALAEEA